MIDYELKFVKRQFSVNRYHYDKNKQKKIEICKSRILSYLDLGT